MGLCQTARRISNRERKDSSRTRHWTKLVLLAWSLGVSSAAAVDVSVSGKALVVRGEPAARVRRAIFKSGKDQSVVLSADPTTVGASVRIESLDCSTGSCVLRGGSGEIVLGSQGWRALGNPPGARGYRYHDKNGTTGGIRTVVLKPGRLVVKAVGSGWPWVPSGPVERAVVEVSVGSDRYCAEFGGTEVINQDGSLRFLNAPAPTACREYCGNGITESGEGCDGEPSHCGFGACTSDCSCPPQTCTETGGCHFLPCCDPDAVCIDAPDFGACMSPVGLGDICESQGIFRPCGPGLECCTAGDALLRCTNPSSVCCATTATCSIDSDCCLFEVLGVGCTAGSCCVEIGEFPCRFLGHTVASCCGAAVCGGEGQCCLPAGELCGSNEECCSEVCDPVGGLCQ